MLTTLFLGGYAAYIYSVQTMCGKWSVVNSGENLD